jgi:hypothetical protein
MGIFSMSDKWRESSILTKVGTGAMALCLFFTLICDIIMISWGLVTGGLVILYLLLLAVLFLLTFGLYKVNRFAKRFVSMMGFGIAFGLTLVIIFYSKADSMSGGFYKLIFGLVNSLMPDKAKAILGLFLLPYILPVISWVVLLFCGKDFKKQTV